MEHDTLADFVAYCQKHPTERFWQALRNWSGQNFILVANELPPTELYDTFYWRGRGKNGTL